VKALVLAAGKGTRLGALTARRPKPMVPVAGRPLLERIVRDLRAAGIEEIFINLHHCADVITGHFGDGSRHGVAIRYSREPELLGTAGAARRLQRELGDRFLVYYGDNFVEIDLGALFRAHERRRPLGTIAVFEAEETRASGVVETDADGRVLRFLEKPAPGTTPSRTVNAGIYVLERAALDVVAEGAVSDFGRDVFPALLRAGADLRAFPLTGRVHGIDTPEALARLEAYLGGR
jgi:NDP-sugar pyrophosphorylase family protein